MSEEATNMEEHFKAVSKLAQNMVKNTPASQVNLMLDTMTCIKNKLVLVSCIDKKYHSFKNL